MKKTTTTPARRGPTQRTYSRDYPIHGGHDYFVRSIPVPLWRHASGRATREGGRSMRTVIIKLLDAYALRGAAVFGGWPIDQATVSEPRRRVS